MIKTHALRATTGCFVNRHFLYSRLTHRSSERRNSSDSTAALRESDLCVCRGVYRRASSRRLHRQLQSSRTDQTSRVRSLSACSGRVAHLATRPSRRPTGGVGREHNPPHGEKINGCKKGSP